MPEPTHTPTLSTDHDQPDRWCHWHKGPSETAVLVDAVEPASGPGMGLYACAPCREQRRLLPLLTGAGS